MLRRNSVRSNMWATLFNVRDDRPLTEARERSRYDGVVWKQHCSIARHCRMCIGFFPFSLASMEGCGPSSDH